MPQQRRHDEQQRLEEEPQRRALRLFLATLWRIFCPLRPFFEGLRGFFDPLPFVLDPLELIFDPLRPLSNAGSYDSLTLEFLWGLTEDFVCLRVRLPLDLAHLQPQP